MIRNISAIFVTWNRPEFTQQTLESFFATMPEAVNEVIVVDNHSDEPTLNYLRKITMEGKICLIEQPTNAGWGYAGNIGIAQAKNDWILISNNDTTFKAGWYEPCMAAYDKYNIGVLGLWKHPTGHTILRTYDDLIVKDQMPAISWLLKKERIAELGGLPVAGACINADGSPRQGGCGEDTGFCDRAKAKGYLVCGLIEDYAQHITNT